MPHIFESQSALTTWLADQQAPAFRAKQIQRWLFQSRAATFADMSDLPQALRDSVAAEFDIWTTTTATHQKAKDGTEKLLLRLSDGKAVECVLLRDGVRRTICISSQVGCAMGCVFCASGLDGVDRNLSRALSVRNCPRSAEDPWRRILCLHSGLYGHYSPSIRQFY